MKGLSIYVRYLLILLALSASISGHSSARASSAGDSRSALAGRTAASDHLRRAKTHPDRNNRPEAVPGRLIIGYEPRSSDAERGKLRAVERLERIRSLKSIGAEVVRVRGRSVRAAIEDLERHPEVEFVTPDYIRYPSGYADEPRFGEQWGNHNTGQVVGGGAGTADVDTNAPEASARTLGDPNLVVAVVDDGVDFSHPDLAERRWTNPGESGMDASGADKASNGVDDDGNGYADDVHGWDFCNGDNTVFDAVQGDAHGTHVAGTLAASVNGEGIAGMAPNVRVMALKFICRGGGADSDAVRAWEYARDNGAKITNNSWGGGGYSPAIEYFIRDNPLFFVFAAGNEGGSSASFPARLPYPNVLSVAAIDNRGNPAPYSNWSEVTVDVAAPGSSILSAVPATPERSALALSSYAAGKAVVAGFGVEEISLYSKRASFARRALAAVGRTTEPIVLVDDDRSGAGAPDGRYWISEAIREATGATPQVINVPSGNGPALSQLTGKVVVWSTGWAYESGGYYASEQYPLTPTDQTTLTNFLAGGGRLILNGLDTLRGIEGSTFVTEVLGLDVLPDVGNRGADRLVGIAGTGFDGESWDLAYHQYNNPYALPSFHDMLAPGVGGSATSLGVYPRVPMGYEYWDGTSMAAPHAAGIAALVASIWPQILGSPSDLRSILMYGSKPAPATVGKTVTGRMLDARAALDALSETSPPSGTILI
ncbi:MAG: S8 family serine peptidase, partial [Chloroflexota bacterium]|nr:S8 family serine peptidase [Chloroflexota bacterium]